MRHVAAGPALAGGGAAAVGVGEHAQVGGHLRQDEDQVRLEPRREGQGPASVSEKTSTSILLYFDFVSLSIVVEFSHCTDACISLL